MGELLFLLCLVSSREILTRTEIAGGGGWGEAWGDGGGVEWGISLMLQGCKMGSNESHCNVSLIVRDKVTRQCPHTTPLEEKGELN